MTDSEWSNWDGRQKCAPARTLRPASEGELAESVARAAGDGLTMRPIGSGHSFTDLCVTGDCQVSLAGLTGIIDADVASGRVRVRAGTPLHELAASLHELGLALENQGDIDRQTISGALATATHGTGAKFRNLAAGVVGCRLVTADGRVREIGDGADDATLLRAARVSLGALGVVSELTLQCVPAFRLRKREEPRELDEVLSGFHELIAEHDHYEFYAFPYSGRVLSLASDRTADDPAPLPGWRKWLLDDLISNTGLSIASRAGRRFPSKAPQVTRAMTKLIGSDTRVDHSHKVFSTVRRVKFTEMEYAIPLAHVPSAVSAVLETIERERIPVTFPIEVRAAAGDDALLSTAHGRATGYVAVHQFEGMPYADYFAAVESIMTALGGRPHWGKRHTLGAEQLAARYPEWDSFQQVRAQLDPAGHFTSDPLMRVLGPVAAAGTGAEATAGR